VSAQKKSEYKCKILICISVMLLEYIIIGEIFVLLLCANCKKKLQIPVCVYAAKVRFEMYTLINKA
jgi:hypothetical protein